MMTELVDTLTLAARDPVAYAIGRVIAVVILVLLVAGVRRAISPRSGPE